MVQLRFPTVGSVLFGGRSCACGVVVTFGGGGWLP